MSSAVTTYSGVVAPETKIYNQLDQNNYLTYYHVKTHFNAYPQYTAQCHPQDDEPTMTQIVKI